ncbi:hypothetical protein CPB83DRAFT_869476 [Crepidotus variabilis]|uniref:P-loop containing nucleoside triphosphate hydrolase protein n=1 Tax=Crepidotus variabilis TaxID=179855 RepID=A0A9P6EG81_9AGAR|nr:hypothetical protein CPB83DRAFT_869476 [Crepidotus variabilis]
MTKVVFIGVSGATCSGKTTLAKHLNRILPDSVIIHQDPIEQVPIHPVHGVQDWDRAEGAITWDKMVRFLRQVKKDGSIPPEHRSHDHLNKQKLVSVDDEVSIKWTQQFEELKEKNSANGGEKIIWGLVDGFLLYWHPEVIEQLDVRIMLRVPYDVLKARRHERHGYHTAVQTDLAEGSLWRDPPGYWDDIVYPAYVDAHKAVFEGEDVEHGKPTSKVEDLIVLETLDITMTDAVERCCEVIKNVAEKNYSS